MDVQETIAHTRNGPQDYAGSVLTAVKARDPGQPEFHQAVSEVVRSLEPVVERHPHYRTERVLERLVEPERVVSFRVAWVDDGGEIRVNRGYRVEMSSAVWKSSRAVSVKRFSNVAAGAYAIEWAITSSPPIRLPTSSIARPMLSSLATSHSTTTSEPTLSASLRTPSWSRSPW